MSAGSRRAGIASPAGSPLSGVCPLAYNDAHVDGDRPVVSALAHTVRGNSPSVAAVRRVLAGSLATPSPEASGRVAAVAAVLRQRGDRAELLFIRRPTRRGDPWSGHMAWPGGKLEPCDGGRPLVCAVRETREETGLDLAADGDAIGSLRSWHHARAAPGRLRAVFPFVFELVGDREPRAGDEVQEAVWIPLEYFTTWSSRRPWSWARRWLPVVPPAFRYDGRLIWGLTQWMLADLLRRLASADRRTSDGVGQGDSDNQPGAALV